MHSTSFTTATISSDPFSWAFTRGIPDYHRSCDRLAHLFPLPHPLRNPFRRRYPTSRRLCPEYSGAVNLRSTTTYSSYLSHICVAVYQGGSLRCLARMSWRRLQLNSARSNLFHYSSSYATPLSRPRPASIPDGGKNFCHQATSSGVLCR